MRTIACDSWAFLEVAMGGDRADEVTDVLASADEIVTSRDVIAETATFLARKPRNARVALDWWDDQRAGETRVVTPDLDALRAWVPAGDLGRLSFADLSLAFVARESGTIEVATADREFRRLGLDPLFAPADIDKRSTPRRRAR